MKDLQLRIILGRCVRGFIVFCSFKFPSCTNSVIKRLVLSLILPHVNYGNIVFTDSTSQRRLGIALKACLRYIHIRRRLDHFSHLKSTVTGTLLVANARILSFLYKILTCSPSLLSVFSVSFCVIGAH
jgi:hypothetical protein